MALFILIVYSYSDFLGPLEFRRAARLARELNLAIEPIFEDEDPRFTKNVYDRNIDPELFRNSNPFETDEYDPTDAATTHDEDTATL